MKVKKGSGENVRKGIRAIGLAFIVAFIVAGVLGMINEWHLPLTRSFWIFFGCFTFGIILGLMYYYWNKLTTLWQRIKSTVVLVLRVITHLTEANNLLVAKEGQKGKEGNYLHLVSQIIEVCHDDSYNSHVAVTFQLISGLLYEFKPQQMWIIPTINGCDILDEKERFDIQPTPNLLSLKPSQTISKAVPIKKEWVRKEIEDAKRTGAKINSQLRIEMETEDGKSIILS